MDAESDERLWKGIEEKKKVYTWPGLTKFRLKLTK